MKTKWLYIISYAIFGLLSALILIGLLTAPLIETESGLYKQSLTKEQAPHFIMIYLFFAYSKAKIDHLKSIVRYIEAKESA